MQHSIFANLPAHADLAMQGVVRDQLSPKAWLDYLPNWLEGHEGIFDSLCQNVDWHHHRRQMYDRVVDVPRLTGSSMRRGCARPALIAQMADCLTAYYERPLRSISYAYYRDGRDSVAMHGDKVGRMKDDCVVAIVAVGAPRRFLLRELGGAGARTLSVGWGDLLVMGGNCQRTWQHGVPKVACADGRISIMFRQSLTTLVSATR